MKPKKSKYLLYSLIEQLTTIRSEMLCMSDKYIKTINNLDPSFKESGKNLIHYLALRRHDIRALQMNLAEMGLSSLGRSEMHVLATIDAVLYTLSRITNEPQELNNLNSDKLDFKTAIELLENHTEKLLGPRSEGRDTHIMVTMPTDAAYDYELVLNLLERGMDCMRINCAHDDESKWSQMIDNLKRAQKETGKQCKILMDLPGPKLRTGPLSPGPTVIKLRPKRDAYGHVAKPVNILLTSDIAYTRNTDKGNEVAIPVDKEWLTSLEIGDKINFVDARDANRTMTITKKTDIGFYAKSLKTSYVVPGTILSCSGKDQGEVKNFPAQENFLTLQTGHILELSKDINAGQKEAKEIDSEMIQTIGCTIPSVLDNAEVGEPIVFDDGKIAGIIEGKNSKGLTIRITKTDKTIGKLKCDKGINLPLSKLQLPALTSSDISLLDFVLENVDIVGLSFVNNEEDIKSLLEQIRSKDKKTAIVIKIETKRGFENLPDILLESMKSPSCGVMIARGDLAVESGYDRLAEVQEEILWLCEASHIPVIWATQVLETLAKQGAPTRAEITDAAMGHRAECVMLNKGPHILEALITLDNILKRMERHQYKKTSMLHKLNLAYNFPKN